MRIFILQNGNLKENRNSESILVSIH
jgi:hypothetical protein